MHHCLVKNASNVENIQYPQLFSLLGFPAWGLHVHKVPAATLFAIALGLYSFAQSTFIVLCASTSNACMLSHSFPVYMQLINPLINISTHYFKFSMISTLTLSKISGNLHSYRTFIFRGKEKFIC